MTATTKLFLGYDPGGRGKNGVAAIEIDQAGSLGKIDTAIVADAGAASCWLATYVDGALALGIDTLVAWSPSGERTCDINLRERYRGRGGNSVLPQNSLYSSMTLNGMIVAMRANLPRCESHPMLLRRANLLPPNIVYQLTELSCRYHEGDALIAAWCASRWYYKAWTTDLFAGDEDLIFPVGAAAYPWPERLVG